MEVSEAQRDLRRAYVGGGPGAMVSGAVWLAAAVAAARLGPSRAFAVLFFGGMLIFPLSTLVCRFAFGRPREDGVNPLGRVALESTVAMIGGLVVAWFAVAPGFVFAAAAIAVGTHYAAFATVYGDRLYWLLAGVIAGVGLLVIFPVFALPGGTIVAVGCVELIFGAVLTIRSMRRP